MADAAPAAGATQAQQQEGGEGALPASSPSFMSSPNPAQRILGEVTQPSEQAEIVVQPIPGVATTVERTELVEGAFPSEVPYPYPPVSTQLPVPEEDGREVVEEEEAVQQEYYYQPDEIAGGAAPLARPPPQVMTALGPMPLPPEIRRKIPEKFVAKPIVEEREIYVAKKEVQERTIEVPHVHYEHKFAEVARNLKIKKLVPRVKEVVKEIPREVYKPVIEEKVIEVPQGVKYVEVPVEVPCSYPPKIIPKPKIQVVERVVETIKPVVKEKIIEVPQTVVKQIPKIKTVEVPYYVPRYVEKIIEVPYQPPDAGTLPPIMVGGLPSRVAATMPTPFQTGPIPASALNEINLPYEARIDITVSQTPPPPGQQFGGGLHATASSVSTDGKTTRMAPGGLTSQPGGEKATILVNPDRQTPAIDLPEGFQWGPPPHLGVSSSLPTPPPPASSPFLPPSSSQLPSSMSMMINQSFSSASPSTPFGGSSLPGFPAQPGQGMVADGPNSFNMPPMMITCPPEVGKVQFAGYLTDPDILTRRGVMPYQGFKSKGNFQMLFPPLSPQPGVPMNPPGTPDVRTIDATTSMMVKQERHGMIEHLEKQVEEEFRKKQEQQASGLFTACCASGPSEQQREILYEQ
ncbi:inner membrane complex protein [Cystoisospora suis]|uniref:Inner membrane complex protein n=1 Tax=Cystoisospora suis TaxID=483139 RepID=A0A2C6JJY2_9APIC|nr:inner membrane complex protein [Cystoisospora suis]